MKAGVDANEKEQKKYALICMLSFAFGIVFIILSAYMVITQGKVVFDYENTPLLPGNLRGLKFREFLWTLFAGLAGIGNGWWYAKLYKDVKHRNPGDGPRQ